MSNRYTDPCVECGGEYTDTHNCRPTESLRTFKVEEFIEKRRPVDMLLWCPSCNKRHIDVGVWSERFHHSHACQYCGMVWRPAVVNTRGVEFLPGFKNT